LARIIRWDAPTSLQRPHIGAQDATVGDVLAEVAKEKMQEAQNRVMGSR
jgi:hypothetical protein